MRLPTLSSTPILSHGGYFRELKRSCWTVVLHESSYTDTMDSRCSRAICTLSITLEDEHEFLVEEQPLPPVVSPTAESPGYVVESDPEEDPEEYEDDETEDGPVDYPMDGGEDGDDDDGDSSGDDADDEDEDEEDEDEEEEEEHLALADSAVVVPTVELVSPPEGTEPVIPPPSTDITTTGARITVAQTPSVTFITTPVPSLYFPSYGCPTNLDIGIASLRPLLMLLMPDDILESERPPHKRSCLFALGSRYEGIREVGYGIRDTWVDPAEAVPEIAPMTIGEDSRTRISQRVTMDSQRVDLLMEDRITHQDSTDYGGGGLCFLRGLGSCDRIESGGLLRASNPP
ncbi:hypothetical protein Tco_0337331 [Tanacetum coccineum]